MFFSAAKIIYRVVQKVIIMDLVTS